MGKIRDKLVKKQDSQVGWYEGTFFNLFWPKSFSVVHKNTLDTLKLLFEGKVD